jgi:hypothetical protein
MALRLLDYDPLSREAVYFELDQDGIATLHQTQDFSHIIEANKMMQNDDDYTKKGIKADWWHYARIPNNLAFKWLKEEGIDIFNKDHKKKVFQKLNDPDYRFLKTTGKRHA